MKTSLYRTSLLLLLSVSSTLLSFSQDSIATRKLQQFAKQYANFSQNYPQEKVYLHFDNTSYFLGETIWFKAYVVRADKNSLSPMSKVLYVELLNAEGYVLQTKKYKITDGQCHGDFTLNDNQFGGFYEIRAYTRYMLNFDDNTYFSRIFPIYDTPKTKGNFKREISERPNSQRIPGKRASAPTTNTPDITFFPEGGNLIQGVSTRVAFKVTNKHGESIVVNGNVYNSKKEPVCEISTEFDGCGSFYITPDMDKYYAEISFDGRMYKINLPAVTTKGYALAVDNSDPEKLSVIVQKSATTPTIPMGMTVSCRGKLYMFQQISMGTDNAIALNIPRKMLPTGVNQFTLYNTEGDVLSERLAFVNRPSAFMKIDAATDKSSYKPYEKVAVNFKLTDGMNQPVYTNFSVAVREGENSQFNPLGPTALTELLLSSEVKGYISNPGFYFQADDNAHRQALELLMLTQGWNRYSWVMMSGKAPFKHKQPLEKQLIIDGSVASILLKRKMKNVEVSMMLLGDSTSQQGKCPTDSVGEFNFGLMDYTGTAKLILQSKIDNKRKDSRIMLNRYFAPAPRPYTNTELGGINQFVTSGEISSGNMIDSIQNNAKLSMSEREHLLKEVTVKGKTLPAKISLKYDINKELDEIEDKAEWEPTDIYGFLERTNKYVSRNGMDTVGNNSILYKGKRIKFVVRTGKYTVTDADVSTPSAGTEPDMNFTTRLPLLDEIESVSIVEDPSSILRLSPSATLDPLRTVICVIERKKNYTPIVNGMRSTTLDGYAYMRQFYSPQYDRYRAPNEKDYRRTLYWNPDVQTDRSGQAIILFYNNNTTGNFHISAETVTQNGIIGAYNK